MCATAQRVWKGQTMRNTSLQRTTAALNRNARAPRIRAVQDRRRGSLALIVGKNGTPFSPGEFLATAGLGKVIVETAKGEHIFSQGAAADAVFYIQKGKVKVSVV